METKKIIIFLLLFIVSDLSSQRATVINATENYPQRWIFIGSLLDKDEDVLFIKSIIEKGKSLGFNGIVLSSRWDTCGVTLSNSFRSRALWIQELCKANSFDFVPCGFTAGYAGALKYYDKNLAASFPVENLVYKATGGEAVPSDNSNIDRFFRGFETLEGDISSLFAFIDYPGKISFVDKMTSYNGNSSIKFENFNYSPIKSARLCSYINVKPYKNYEVSFWCKAENLPSDKEIRIEIYSSDSKRWIINKKVKGITGEWQKIALEFNSLEFQKLKLYCGLWNGTSGKFWIDDLKVEPKNDISYLIRRDGSPFSVKNKNTGTVYTENKDFSIEDQGNESYKIKILPSGNIKNGNLLLVSYYRSYLINNTQTSVCMSNPGLYEIWNKSIDQINTVLKPKSYFLSMDEIRQGGYCTLCSNTMSKTLGDCVTKLDNMIKSNNPEAEVFSWGDMFDPNLNARKDYAMIKGGFEGSWNYIPKTIRPVVWDYNKRDDSLKHFKNNGFKSFVSVSVDSSDMNNWKKSLDSNDPVLGIMYTTWKKDYSKLEDFSRIFF
jgi:hypothetical protein